MAKNKGTGGWGELYPADKITGRFIDREVEIGYPNNYHLTQVGFFLLCGRLILQLKRAFLCDCCFAFQALWRASKYVGCGESEMPWGGGTCRIQVCRYSKVSSVKFYANLNILSLCKARI